MRTPDYQTNTEVYCQSNGATKTIPAYSFVRPIELRYVPKHITDQDKWFNPEHSVYCYTHFGIVSLRRTDIRKVS